MEKNAPVAGSGLAGAVKFVVRTYLEERHYKKLHRVLAKEWSNSHSLLAAVRLMEAHGVMLTPAEQSRLVNLPEDRMIDALVMKMPQQSREQFEHFFLQLSLIASTTTRLRSAIESGSAEQVEEIMDAAEDVGILQFILKMAVTQAGNEVMNRQAEHIAWLGKTDVTMAPLLRGQADAMISQKALAQARAALNGTRLDANEKSRKVLMGVIAGNADALRTSMFATWAEYVSKQKKEAEIRIQYEEQIEAAETRLFEYRESQLKNVRGVVMRQAAEGDKAIISACFDAMKQELDEKKFLLENGETLAAMESKLKSMAENQSSAAKKFMNRMNAGNENSTQTFFFQAWQKFCEDYNKNREYEDALKESEKKVAQFMSNQNDGAKSVLNRMNESNNTGLMFTCLKAWMDWLTEEKKMLEMKEIMENNASKMSSFTGKNKKSADSVMQRYAEAQDLAVQLAPFHYWKREAKIEGMRRSGQNKDGKRKEQLAGVKDLFKNFASDLDAGLKAGTPRVETGAERAAKRRREQAGGDAS